MSFVTFLVMSGEVFWRACGIAHLDLRVEQRGGELFIDAFGYPPLAEVEVEVVESNGLRSRRPQCFERLPYRLVVGVLIQKGLHPVGFLDDVACDELVGDFVAVDEGIEVDAPFQFFEHLLLRGSRKRSHVLQIDPSVFVQTGDQRLVRIFGMGDLVGVESYGMVENIGLAGFAVDVAFQRQHLRSPRIHLDEVEVAFAVEPTEMLREVIVKPVEHLAQGGILRLCLRLVVVEVEIGVAYLDVEGGFRALRGRQIQRVEHGTQGIEVAQVADATVLVHYQRPIAVVRQHISAESSRLGIERRTGRCGTRCLFCRPLLPTLGGLLPKLHPSFGREFHHHLVEPVYRRVLLPVQTCIQLFRVVVLLLR